MKKIWNKLIKNILLNLFLLVKNLLLQYKFWYTPSMILKPSVWGLISWGIQHITCRGERSKPLLYEHTAWLGRIIAFQTQYLEAPEPKWVNPVLNTNGVNSLRLGDLHLSWRHSFESRDYQYSLINKIDIKWGLDDRHSIYRYFQ